MLFICTKIKNVAVAFLVLLVFETTSKKKQKILPCEQSCCCHVLRTRKKLQKPHTYNLVVITPLEHEKFLARKKNWSEKKFGAKKIQIFLLKLTIQKIS